MRPRPLPLVVALVLAVAAAAATAPGPAAAAAAAARPQPARSRTVTLLTGDKVVLSGDAAGRQGLTVVPARRAGGPPTFLTNRAAGHLHVIPSDVAALVGGLLDPDLFDVTQLVREGLDDRNATTLPVIVQRTAGAAPPAGLTARAGGTARALSSVGGVALRLQKAEGERLAPALAARARAAPSAAGAAAPASGDLAGVTRIWLDHKVRATALDPNLTQIHAPTAWKTASGQGVRVAVLDSGIDAGHPDLAGQVVAEANFSDAASTTDKLGHGTHVAAIIAGTGARAQGRRRGVAFGADLLNGKVLDDFGFGLDSGVLEGMEWAATHQAKVVNMSLGSFDASDGSDPVSLAVDRLTGRYGTLFVVAAGNAGPDATTIGSPGAASSALTVGAVDRRDNLAFFSSRGPRAGDYALKPDLTAPGVDIVAARAAGTSLGEPVDQWYTRLSGTSMATPHAAGGAALLAQVHPDWAPAQIKAALMATAVPKAGVSPYSQGAGRLDVGHAVTQLVTSDQASLDFGYFRWPHTGDRPVTRRITWHNPHSRPITLSLALDLRDPAGKPAAPGVASLSASSVTLPAGGSASVAVRLDVRKAVLGLHGGYLVANQGSLRTPVAFYNEPERYDLVLRGTGRTGRPPTVGFVSVLNLDTGEVPGPFFGTVLDQRGRATLRVAPGTYSVMGTLIEIDEHNRWLTLSLVGDPQVTVGRATTVRLDARKGRRLGNQVAAERTEPVFLVFGYTHQAAGTSVGSGFFLFPEQVRWPVFMQPTEKVTKGRFTAESLWRLRPPLASMEALGQGAPAIDPLVPAGAAELDGRREVALVDAGLGRKEDYGGKDVAGKLALVKRSDLDLGAVVRNAADAGAALVAVANDQPGPFLDSVREVPSPIPSYLLTGREGRALLALLARRPVTVRVTGNRRPAHVYDMLLVEPDRIPPSVSYRFTDADLARRFARVTTAIHTLNEDAEYGEGRMAWNPRTGTGTGVFYTQPAPLRRTDFVLASGARWEQHAFWLVADSFFDGIELSEPEVAYRGGQQATNRWFRVPLRPGFPARGTGCCPPLRDATTLYLGLDDFMDADRHAQWFGGFFIFNPKVKTVTRFYRDGKLVKRVKDSFAVLPMARGPAGYRIERDVDASALLPLSGRSLTVWTFRSKAPAKPWTPVRLMEVDWNLQVDAHGRALVP
ncbi:MAG TPA: S8 family serine peptidase, partial [Actinomycetota bacterium]|nr:S8 family serine peptidase [Actinomycetota bacterium]